MALTVEDGTGLANAESYLSVANADTYFAAHGSPTAWTDASTPLKEAALRYATKWLDGRYDWTSMAFTLTQALLWPRFAFYDDDGRHYATGVPQGIKDALCEAAVAHLTNALNEIRNRGGAIQSITAGSVQVVWSAGASAGRTFPYVDTLVAPFLDFGGQRRLVRG